MTHTLYIYYCPYTMHSMRTHFWYRGTYLFSSHFRNSTLIYSCAYILKLILPLTQKLIRCLYLWKSYKFVEIMSVCWNHVCLWKSCKLLKSCLFVEIMQIVEIMSVCRNHARFYTNYLRIKDYLTFEDSLVFKHRPSSRSK